MRAIIVLFIVLPTAAQAYLGPGMGGGILTAVLGFILALFLGLFAVIYFPIRRFFAKRAKKKVIK